jgi:hypothetical protein
MKILGAAAVLLLVGIGSPVCAAPIVLTCTGEATETKSIGEAPDTEWVSSQSRFAAEIVLDAEARLLSFNGRKMVISAMTDSEIVFASRKPGVIMSIGLTYTYVLSRRSGVLRFCANSTEGSGLCRKVEQADKLF